MTATATRPTHYGRACPRCGLLAVVPARVEHGPAGYVNTLPPWPAPVGWWCPCGTWVNLVPERGRRWTRKVAR